MSTNIDACEVISGGLFIRGAQLKALREEIGEELCEGNWVTDVYEAINGELDPDYLYPVDRPFWSGAWSGNSYAHILVEKALPRTCGKADIVYFWEGGDFMTGVRVVDGVVTEHAVCLTLGSEV